MKKEPYRDYATMALREWAAAGCPSAEEAGEVYSGAVLADMVACAAAFRELSPEICAAVRAVYMVPGPIGKGELTGRVLRFSAEHYISETQVWVWLGKARRLFALRRGLRV